MRAPILIFLLCFVYLGSTSLVLAQSNSESSNSVNLSDAKEVRYISDELFIFLHAGAGRDFRIVGSISAGTAVSLLQVDREAGYAQVQDDRERIGWVESKFVSRTPSISASLASAIEQVEQLQDTITNAEQMVTKAKSDLGKSEQQKLVLNRKLTKSLEQNAELERRLAQKGRSDQMQWFTRGTILALFSVVIGYLLGLFGRKKANANPLR